MTQEHSHSQGREDSGPGIIGPEVRDLTLAKDDRKVLLEWAAQCAERLLLQTGAPDMDHAPLRDAVAGAHSFIRGDLGVADARKLAFACHAAAREASEPVSVATARVFGHMIAIAHMGGHSREVVRYARKAMMSAGVHVNDVEAELEAQRDSLPKRYQDYVYSDLLK